MESRNIEGGALKWYLVKHYPPSYMFLQVLVQKTFNIVLTNYINRFKQLILLHLSLETIKLTLTFRSSLNSDTDNHATDNIYYDQIIIK